MKLVVGIYVLFLTLQLTLSACTFPAGFQNTWITSSRGTWTVDSTIIYNMSIYTTITGPVLYTMDCYADYNNFFVIRSQEIFAPFSTVQTYIYMCLSLTQMSTFKYLYSFGTTETKVLSNVYERLILRLTSVTSVSASDVCNDTSYDTSPDRINVALLSGSETSGKQNCPSIMQGAFTYSGTSCSSNYVDICTDNGQIAMNTTQCSEKTMFSENGVLDCVYEKTIGSNTYVIVYNEDPSPDGSTYYQFSCVAVSKAGLLLYTSANPEKCASSQVSTTAPTGGYITVYTDDTNYTSSTTATSTEDLTWLYVLIGVFGGLLFVGLLILIMCTVKRRKKSKDEEVAEGSKSDVKSEKEDEKSDDEKQKENPSTSTKVEEDRTSVDSGVITDKEAVVVALEEKVEKETSLQKEKVTDDKVDDDDDDEEEKNDNGNPSEDEMEMDNDSVKGIIMDTEHREKDEKLDSDKELEDKGTDDGISNRSNSTHGKKEEKKLTDEDAHNKERDDEEYSEKSDSQSEKSSSTASLDNIDEVGKPKPGDNILEVTLSKFLISRAMEEKARDKRSRKKKGVKKLFAARKSKRGKVSSETSEAPDDSNDLDFTLQCKSNAVPFLEQYNTKKEIEKRLDEEHYWSDEDEKNKDIFHLDEFENILQNEEVEEKKLGQNNAKAIEENNVNQKLEEIENNEESDDDIDITNELPEGFSRNENGRITRLSDGYVFTNEEFIGQFKPAKLKRLFTVPRLNRNMKGRPTGGMKDDKYGPEVESVPENKAEEDEDKHTESEERLNRELRKMESKQKIVGFDLKHEPDDVINYAEKDTESNNGKGTWADATAGIREKLRNRLFRKKKKRKSMHDVTYNNGNVIFGDETEEGQPRELNGLIKVYGKHSIIPGVPPRSTLPPTGMQKDSERILKDQNQLQTYREGLAKDKDILNNVRALPPIGAKKQKIQQLRVKEAFSDVKLENTSDEELGHGDSIELGNEDEFFLVGSAQNEDNRLFTRVPGPLDKVRKPGHTHDMRHTIPWSMLKGSSTSNFSRQAMSRSMDDGPRSADFSNRRSMDDKRLRELLEELYKDKKYFDHMIDTSEPHPDSLIDTRNLAERGREYLLDRAEFWDDRGPVPPRPPPTALGLRISKIQTVQTNDSDSGRVSMVSTVSPPIIEPPNQIPLTQEQTSLPNIEPSNQISLRQENTFS